jgi:hypothetical protein
VIRRLHSALRRAVGPRPDEIAARTAPVTAEAFLAGATPRDRQGRVDFDALAALGRQADLDRPAATIGGRTLPLRLFFDPRWGNQQAVVEVLGLDGRPTNTFTGLTFTAALTRLGLVIDSEEGTGAPNT